MSDILSRAISRFLKKFLTSDDLVNISTSLSSTKHTKRSVVDIGESYKRMALVDIASTKYSAQYQQLLAIQQNAGFYIAALAIVFTSVLSLINPYDYTASNQYTLMYSIFIHSLFLIIPFCLYFLLRVILPSVLLDIPYSSKIEKSLSGEIAKDSILIQKMLDSVNKNVTSLCNVRMIFYRKAIVCLYVGLTYTMLAIFFYYLKICIPKEYFGQASITLLISTAISICIIFVWKGTMNEQEKNLL